MLSDACQEAGQAAGERFGAGTRRATSGVSAAARRATARCFPSCRAQAGSCAIGRARYRGRRHRDAAGAPDARAAAEFEPTRPGTAAVASTSVRCIVGGFSFSGAQPSRTPRRCASSPRAGARPDDLVIDLRSASEAPQPAVSRRAAPRRRGARARGAATLPARGACRAVLPQRRTRLARGARAPAAGTRQRRVDGARRVSAVLSSAAPTRAAGRVWRATSQRSATSAGAGACARSPRLPRRPIARCSPCTPVPARTACAPRSTPPSSSGRVDAVKIGMLASAGYGARGGRDACRRTRGLPLVLDPVLAAYLRRRAAR